MAEVLVAKTSAVLRTNGRKRVITAGKTYVRADDPIVKGREHMFKDAGLGGGVEEAMAAPGKPRVAKRTKPGQKKLDHD